MLSRDIPGHRSAEGLIVGLTLVVILSKVLGLVIFLAFLVIDSLTVLGVNRLIGDMAVFLGVAGVRGSIGKCLEKEGTDNEEL